MASVVRRWENPPIKRRKSDGIGWKKETTPHSRIQVDRWNGQRPNCNEKVEAQDVAGERLERGQKLRAEIVFWKRNSNKKRKIGFLFLSAEC